MCCSEDEFGEWNENVEKPISETIKDLKWLKPKLGWKGSAISIENQLKAIQNIRKTLEKAEIYLHNICH